MPIKGLTDNVQAAFPRIGKLRKGGPMRDKDGKKYMGPDLEYFRFTSERPEVQAAFEAAYGDKPALINCYLPHATVEENFDTWKERWAAGGLVHRCDGETMTLWLGDDGKHYRTPKPCDSAGLDERDRCKPVGRLSLWIPELMRAGFIGYVTLESHGINDLLSIQASLKAALETRGNEDLRGIEWRLFRVMEKISTPMGPSAPGKRARRDKWLVKLEPAPRWVTLQIEAAKAEAYRALPAPRLITEDGEIVDGEAVPEDELARELADAEPPTDEIEPPEYGDYTEEGTLHDQSVFEPVTEMRLKCGREIARLGYSPTQVDGHCRKHYGGLGYAELGLDALTTLYERLAKIEKKAS